MFSIQSFSFFNLMSFNCFHVFYLIELQGMNCHDTTAMEVLLSLSVWCVKDNGRTLYSISLFGFFSACVPNYF